MKDIEKRLEELENQVQKMQKTLDRIQNELFIEEDEGVEFEIECPYCENSFIVELTEINEEVKCPECNNTIELDWTGNTEWEEQNNSQFGCNGGDCPHCSGCEDIEEIDIEDDM